MFRESQKEVHDWLSSQRGVVVPGVGVAFPYLPPFVSSLSTLNALLQARTSLTESTLQLLSRESEPRHPQIDPDSTKTTSSPDLPDSTTDCKPATDNTGNPGNTPDTHLNVFHTLLMLEVFGRKWSHLS